MEVVELDYAPRPLQQKLHELRERHRFSVWVCHRRFGKTVLCINELIKGAFTCRHKRPRLGYVAPLLKQAKQVAWDYAKEYSRPIPGAQFNEAELRVDYPNGARLQLFGADNPDALRGIYLDGVVLDEYAQMNPSVWSQVIRPMLTDRQGWAVFIGTPAGHNAFYDLYQQAETLPGWNRTIYRASETGVLDGNELEAARLTMTEEEYEQEFECSFEAAIRGSYYGKLMAQLERTGRVGDVPYDPAVPVSTAWDIGIGDDTAIWFFQQKGPDIHVIDFYAGSGVGLAQYVKVISDKPYSYGLEPKHIGPHDLRAREWGSGRTREEQAKKLNLKFTIVPNVSVDDGINATRAILPRCVFDKAKCAEGIEALKQYRRDYDERRQVFRDRPLHDWTSHAADAMRYLALGVKEQYLPPEPRFERTFNEELVEHMRQSASEERI